MDRYQQFAREYAYVLKLDIRRYFPSIDRTILIQQLDRRIKDKSVLDLLHRIIDNGPETGGPVQFFPGDDLVSVSERRRGLPIGQPHQPVFCQPVSGRVRPLAEGVPTGEGLSTLRGRYLPAGQ